MNERQGQQTPTVLRSVEEPRSRSQSCRLRCKAQSAAIHPGTGKLWIVEHGPRGGDEINIPEPGKNYGWPVIGYGIDYSGAKIHEAAAKAGMEQPVKYWVPSIAPSGMAFYTGNCFRNGRAACSSARCAARCWCG